MCLIKLNFDFQYFIQKTADIAICDLTKNIDRMRAVDFTTTYFTVPLTFLTVKPGLKSRKWIAISPFSVYIWLLMGISFIVTSISIQQLYWKLVLTYNRIDSISISLVGALLQQCKYENIQL